MTILLSIFLVSSLIMSIMLWSKVRMVRAQEIAHHEHVGVATIFTPLFERILEWVRIMAAKAYSFIYPIVQYVMYRGGLILHALSERIGKKFLNMADAIKGRGVLKHRGDAPMFLRDIIEHQRALRGKLEV